MDGKERRVPGRPSEPGAAIDRLGEAEAHARRVADAADKIAHAATDTAGRAGRRAGRSFLGSRLLARP